MDELEALLAQLGTLCGGSAPVAGPPSPGASFAGPGGTMTGNPNAATNPGGSGTAGILGVIKSLLSGTSGGGSPGGTGGTPGLAGGINLQQILALITALGGGQYGSQELNAIKALYQQQQLAAQRAMNAKQISARGAAATLPINKELAYTTDAAADANSANAGLAQSPGAVAAARAGALAPLAEQNVQVGQENARFGFPYQFQTQAPDYLSVLQQLNTLGRNTGPYSLPGAV